MNNLRLSCLSLNVRGLNDTTKRNSIYSYLESQKADIICLQETFCTREKLQLFSKNWNGKIYHCPSDSPHSRGVCIMLRNKK